MTFNVTGSLIWLDENGEPDGPFDVFDYIKLCKEHPEKVGPSPVHAADGVPIEGIQWL